MYCTKPEPNIIRIPERDNQYRHHLQSNFRNKETKESKITGDGGLTGEIHRKITTTAASIAVAVSSGTLSDLFLPPPLLSCDINPLPSPISFSSPRSN
ncbi:hypothetical protein HanIR_Chr12g0609831 [Helianthus annuus]|nr:hypothetical protein HanIR_Chr12g0609831 [Helianthus annuus]